MSALSCLCINLIRFSFLSVDEGMSAKLNMDLGCAFRMIPNVGNTCAFTCIIMMLNMVEEFVHHLLQHDDDCMR